MSIRKIYNAKRAQKKQAAARYYNMNSILGNDWAMFYVILGSRKTGKSYGVADYLLRRKDRLGDKCKNYWMRISETSTKAQLANNAQYLIDPDLVKKWKVEFKVKGMDVYNKDQIFTTVIPLSKFGKLKGVGFYDKDYDGEYNIVLDEFQLEKKERRTSFDILYNFIGMCENIARTTKSKIKVFLLGNTLEEASTILKAFNFLPESFGRFYLRPKRCVIDNIEPTEEYFQDRAGSISSLLGGDSMSNYTNAIQKDRSLLYKGRVKSPTAIIKFDKDPSKWYVLWDGKVIKKWKRQKLPKELDFCMIPRIDSYFSPERRQTIIDMFNARVLKFDNLITQAYFTEELALI